jgi:hypothetical protein
MSWSTTNLEIGLKQVLGLERDKEFKQANGDTRIYSEVLSHKGSYVSVEVPRREGYHQEPPFLFQSPRRKIGAH